jgi:hypothetical protein
MASLRAQRVEVTRRDCPHQIHVAPKLTMVSAGWPETQFPQSSCV